MERCELYSIMQVSVSTLCVDFFCCIAWNKDIMAFVEIGDVITCREEKGFGERAESEI